jgi:hypothetical protein
MVKGRSGQPEVSDVAGPGPIENTANATIISQVRDRMDRAPAASAHRPALGEVVFVPSDAKTSVGNAVMPRKC